MNDVLVNDPVEDMFSNEAKITVDGGKRSLDVGPVVGVEVVDFRVGVVEVGDGDCAAFDG